MGEKVPATLLPPSPEAATLNGGSIYQVVGSGL